MPPCLSAEIEGGQQGTQPYVKACRMITPRWELRAYQFTGWEAIQQNIATGHDMSVMPYTW